MAAALVSPDQCCTPACDATTVVNIPGPKGDQGAACTPCDDGENAFTLTDADFTMPAELANVAVTVLSTAWMAVGQIIFIATAGYFKVVSIGDAVTVTLKNLEDSGSGVYPDNAAPAATISSGQKVSPGGVTGPSGTSASGDLLAANDLSDLDHPTTTALTNIGGTTVGKALFKLGNPSAITFIRINADNTVTALSAANFRTALTLVVGTDVQAWDAELSAIAALVSAADRLAYFTGAGTAALGTFTSAARSLVDDATITEMRTTLGKILPRYGLLGSALAIDANAATTDTAITIEATRYIIDKVTVDNGSISLTTATAGVFTAAGGAGTTLAADQALAALTATTKYKNLTLAAIVGTDVVTAGTVYNRIGTPQGSAATVDVRIFGWRLD